MKDLSAQDHPVVCQARRTLGEALAPQELLAVAHHGARGHRHHGAGPLPAGLRGRLRQALLLGLDEGEEQCPHKADRKTHHLHRRDLLAEEGHAGQHQRDAVQLAKDVKGHSRGPLDNPELGNIDTHDAHGQQRNQPEDRRGVPGGLLQAPGLEEDGEAEADGRRRPHDPRDHAELRQRGRLGRRPLLAAAPALEVAGLPPARGLRPALARRPGLVPGARGVLGEDGLQQHPAHGVEHQRQERQGVAQGLVRVAGPVAAHPLPRGHALQDTTDGQ
mmetsp:Transcript_1131/g.3133  ORF Transcript_1131/g.3133 Transcript_1131/m.3133 type:complete len:275 (+) Transcript_1131:92-916(+)